jgi:hypothetical protein
MNAVDSEGGRRRLVKILSAGAMLIVSACSIEGDCENEILDRAQSPDGTMVATVFSRGCGATVDTNFQIYVSTYDPI